MALELYLDLYSQPCRSVYIFAKKNNIPFDFRRLSLLDVIGGVCLCSIAILLYLAEKFQTPDFWYPADLQQRARVNEYLSWQHMAIRMHGSKMFWLRLLIPKVLGVEVPQDKLDAALEDLNGSLKLIEEKFLQDRPFIAGDHISLADLVAIVEVMQPVGSGLDVFEGRPKLSAWRDRVQEAIGKELFDDAHRTIMGSQEAVKLMDGSKMQVFKPKILRLFL
ncbi:Glutathione S-transferase theta-1 [Collichthys lucidus]|uniref:glutathione transferase n=1 Tax=Collichthys lucidus TaxID=240159 RepID=A0A4U5U589_COLLU|nr:Glutathione S-transferase theta-1 [Collichthys lucidus]